MQWKEKAEDAMVYFFAQCAMTIAMAAIVVAYVFEAVARLRIYLSSPLLLMCQ
jgi:hypothetical protein